MGWHIGPDRIPSTAANSTSTAYIVQLSYFGAIHGQPNGYRFQSGNVSTTPPYGFGSDVPARPGYLVGTSLSTETQGTDPAGTWLGSKMTADGITLTKEGAFSASGNLPLNASLGTWTGAPWSAELRLETDGDDALYRLCWRVRLPNINRLSCGKFDRLTAEFRGIYVSDASYGEAVIWETAP